MVLIVFAGPSVGKPDVAMAPRIDFRPPARCGDITRAVGSRPTIIGLIDGVFETAAAVWHKEIIYALSQGIIVLGAASMGALRAVELKPFGMIGIGTVFNAYLAREIEDDDEVAIQHGPSELGYLPLTEAMVNIRSALKCATAENILTESDALALNSIAKSLFYKYRTWARILADGAAVGVSNSTLELFREWLEFNPIDIKREDARELIRFMLACHPHQFADQFRPSLNRTVYWANHEARFVTCESQHEDSKEMPSPHSDRHARRSDNTKPQ